MTRLFFSYSHVDELFREQLEIHMAMLKKEQRIVAIHDRCIHAGDHVDHRIDGEMRRADIVGLLVSPDFLDSKYCYDIEMQRALERSDRKLTRVIPIIVRPCDWHSAPFGRLLACPRDGKAISLWPNRDEALLDVTRAIRGVLPMRPKKSTGKPKSKGPQRRKPP